MPESAPEEEDEAEARKRRLADRMAKLGGIRFGAPPPIGRPPPPRIEREAEEGGAQRPKEKGREEEDDDEARRQRIAAKLASMSGMRIGMVPGAIPPKPPAPARKDSARRRIQASDEFELDGQRVVLIDTPGFNPGDRLGPGDEGVTGDIEEFLAKSYVKRNCGIVVFLEVRLIKVLRYPIGTKLAGVVFVQRFTTDNTTCGRLLCRSIKALKALCGDTTLKNVVIMTHRRVTDRHEAEQILNTDLSPGGCFHPAIEQGAQVYHCTGAYNPDLGALRIILRGRPVEELLRELGVQKRRAQQEADVLKKRIADMQSEKESTRKEFCHELEEQKRRAREEADGFRKRIAQMQSELEEDRHRFGKASATYNSRHIPAHPI